MKTNKISINIPTIGDVIFTADVEMVNNGIGSYEFWGSRCIDNRYEPEVQDVFWDKTLYNEEQNKFIDKYITDEYEIVDSLLIKDLDCSETDYFDS
jgi:hypothetical protein